ncbi:MAG: hypothetical protein KHZ87_00040 [Clostridiales bacterium]|nr:hypothetical protein [Clostridiales bacterium]MBS5877535.1 hypothetical protein [Clostridiales bacterium]MDU0939736.1 DUF6290 family protein [Clostridiales bacterium]MDU1042807.1 DUF6290 family protein [Clostridiales bacterium]MDU3489838.1 DUF6290 family protein [Clostridiales bacterium]
MTISLRLDEADTTLFKNFAKLHGITVSELVRSSVIARIEDEYRFFIIVVFKDRLVSTAL